MIVKNLEVTKVDFRSFEYLLALEKYQSLKDVARNYGVTEQTVKNYIIRLEEEFQISCFDKSINKNKFILSPYGKKVKKIAITVLEDYQQLQKELNHSINMKIDKNKSMYDFIIGVSAIPKYKFMDDIFDDMLEHGFYVSVIKKDPIDIVLNTISGKLTVGLFTWHNKIKQDWNTQAIILPLTQEQPYIVIEKRHSLATRKKVTIEDLKNHKLAIYQEGDTPANPSISYLYEKNIPQVITNDCILFEKAIIKSNAVGFITDSLIGGKFFNHEERLKFIPFDSVKGKIYLIINRDFYKHNFDKIKFFLNVLLDLLQRGDNVENRAIRDFLNCMQDEFI